MEFINSTQYLKMITDLPKKIYLSIDQYGEETKQSFNDISDDYIFFSPKRRDKEDAEYILRSVVQEERLQSSGSNSRLHEQVQSLKQQIESLQQGRRERDAMVRRCREIIYLGTDKKRKHENELSEAWIEADASVQVAEYVLSILSPQGDDEPDTYLSALPAGKGGWISVEAVKLLAIRDALVKDDYTEAYHQLYSIVDPEFAKLDPWEELSG